jgi:glucose/arabinose dehydrogenase
MRRMIWISICATALTIGPALGQSVRLEPYLTGLDQPVGLVAHPTNPTLQFVIEKTGRIRMVENGVVRPDPFLNLSGQVASGSEQGLLGLAFDPAYETTRRFWVNFTRTGDGATVIARFVARADDPYRADDSSRLDLLFDTQPDRRFIAQPAPNHNGGRIFFGTDNYLYIAMGDGGGGNDQYRHGQTTTSLLGKLLRIDPHVPDVASAPLEQRADAERGYRVPPTNPFVAGTPIPARPEIWAFGLRNPWRVTVDEPRRGGTGGLFIADVGQSGREEVSYEPPARGGRNYGWPLREGTVVNPQAPTGTTPAYLPLIDPIFEYGRDVGISITGGYVYRGSALGAAMQGRYVFGDLSNRLYSIAVTVDPATGEAQASDFRNHTAEVGPLAGSLVSIDREATGELVLVMLNGTILRLTSTEVVDSPQPPPGRIRLPVVPIPWPVD